MVKIRHDLPRRADGRPDTDAWLAGLADGDGGAGVNAPMAAAIDLVHDDRSLEYGLEVAQLLIELGLDKESVVTAVLCEVAGSGLLDPVIVRDRVGRAIAGQLQALLRVSSTHVYRLSSSPMVRSQSEDQVDNIRHLLVALIDDPRVAVVKLAERVIALRMAKSAPPAVQRRVANEALRIFAPLAGRLGVWQLKWTLEDLAFRYLHPRDYKEIATALDSRREEREREVEAVVADIERRLARAGIEADVVGRAKHIYSIWRKMGRKSIDFGQVYDVQAVRVVVRSVPQCYGVLGVVHTAWHHIPSEFDDYIANPKDNGYRSIHTAVMIPGGKVLEVQIRTAEMDDESEWASARTGATRARRARRSAPGRCSGCGRCCSGTTTSTSMATMASCRTRRPWTVPTNACTSPHRKATYWTSRAVRPRSTLRIASTRRSGTGASGRAWTDRTCC